MERTLWVSPGRQLEMHRVIHNRIGLYKVTQIWNKVPTWPSEMADFLKKI